MKKIKELKIAGFWIRLMARLIDVLILFIISFFLTWLFLEKKFVNEKLIGWVFKENYLFYVYAFIIVFFILFLFVLLPIIWNGKTLGHFITRTKIVAENNLLRSILTREIFWSFSWIFCIILTTTIINHTLFFKFISNNINVNDDFSAWETTRISFVTSIASIIVLMQMFLAISIIARPNKLGLQDVYSKTKVVYLNKYIYTKIEDNNKNELLKPQKIKEIIINYIQ